MPDGRIDGTGAEVLGLGSALVVEGVKLAVRSAKRASTRNCQGGLFQARSLPPYMRYKHHDSLFLLRREPRERPCIRQAKGPYWSSQRKSEEYFGVSVMCKRVDVITVHSHLLELLSCASYSRCESHCRP